MRHLLSTVSVLTCVLFVSTAFGQTAYKATMDEAQAGGTGSTATGSAVLILNEAMDELTMEIEFVGIMTSTFTAFHIHSAPAGMNGGVVFGLVSPGHDNDGDFVDTGTAYISEWDSNDSGSALSTQLTALMSEGLYFNGHTAAHPGGEIRGQIIPVVPGDVDLSGDVNLLDVQPFVNLLSTNGYQIEADINLDDAVNLLDVQPFVDILSKGG